jgi:hypothetical protein
LSLFTAGSTTQRLLSKKTARMGDKAKPSGVGGADGFAVCGAAFLCCASHSVASNSGPFAARLTRPFLQLAAEKLDALRDACPKPGIVRGNFEGSRASLASLFLSCAICEQPKQGNQRPVHHRVTHAHPAIYNMVIPAAAGGGCTASGGPACSSACTGSGPCAPPDSW